MARASSWRTSWPGQATSLSPITHPLLECLQSIRLLDDKEKKAWGDDIRVRNNLILGSPQEDVVFLDRDETTEQSRGDGDGAAGPEDLAVRPQWT